MASGVIFNRKVIYQFLYDNIDSNNNITLAQGEVAKVLGMSIYEMSRLFKEFSSLGLIEKHKHTFTVLYNPDEVPWDKYEKMRKKYSEFLRTEKQK
jgi:hypothetical protein